MGTTINMRDRSQQSPGFFGTNRVLKFPPELSKSASGSRCGTASTTAQHAKLAKFWSENNRSDLHHHVLNSGGGMQTGRSKLLPGARGRCCWMVRCSTNCSRVASGRKTVDHASNLGMCRKLSSSTLPTMLGLSWSRNVISWLYAR